MDALAAFHFLRPQWLALAPLALLVWWWWRRHADPLRGWREQIAPALLEALVPGGAARRAPRGGGLLAGWLLAVLALSGPSWRLETGAFGDDATPLLVLLKADASMDQPAPSPRERARMKIADLAAARKGQPLGLIAYAGSAHLVLPPTRDTAVVARMAAEIEAGIMPEPGDRLDLALEEAARVLGAGAAGGSIVVFADRVETDAGALRAAAANAGIALQFLALCVPGTAPCASIESAASALDARLEPLRVTDEDVRAIVRRAARAPVSHEDAASARWQDDGYWLVPLLALLVLASFRRHTDARAAA